jgi:hypothetical protein
MAVLGTKEFVRRRDLKGIPESRELHMVAI